MSTKRPRHEFWLFLLALAAGIMFAVLSGVILVGWLS